MFEVRLYDTAGEKSLRTIDCETKDIANRMKVFVLKQTFKELEGDDAEMPPSDLVLEQYLLKTYALEIRTEEVTISLSEFVGFKSLKLQ